MPQALGDFYVRSFWFTLFPHPALVAAAAAVIFGGGMLWAALALRRGLRHAARTRAPVREPVAIGVTSTR